MTQARKLVLLDGNSLANRAFYALRLFSTSDGVYTNAVYGFLTMLYKLLDEEKPDYLAVAFDMGRDTFRHAEYAAYKGTRKAAPEEFRPQLDLLREVLTALNIAWFRMEKYEADDLLGTLSRQAAEQGVQTLVVTGDRDALQLIDEHVTVLFTKKGISDVIRYDRERLMADLGLRPEQIIDLKALMGDASDNIPGVPGVGEKTALKLLKEYGSLDGVYAHLEEIKGALKMKLITGRDSAYLSRRLATIDRNAPVSFDPEQLRVREPNYAEALPLFRRLEFKSLLPKVTPPEGAPEAATVAEVEVRDAFAVVHPVMVSTAEELVNRIAEANPAEVTLVASCRIPSDNPGCPEPARVAVGAGETVLYAEGEAVRGVADLLESGRPVVGFDLKPVYNWVYAQGRQPAEPAFDVILAAYLLDPGRTAYRLEDLARQHGLGELPEGETPEALATRAAALLRLRPVLEEALEREGLTHVFRDIEMPLLPILAEMEAAGIGVDPAALQEMSREVGAHIDELTGEIYALAGTVFNIGSPKQLGEVLFERLGLPARKKTKSGGYSTDAEVLEELAEQHEIVAKILDYRTLTKLKGTYLDALGALVARDGRIHTTFTQTVAETGRLSSKDPNLQNIPIRIEEGRRIRRAFVPREGNVFLAADYSQIELRVVAHFSGDPALREAFAQDQDIHTRTASVVWDVPMDQVTPQMRRQAKAVNFGLIYGQTDFGLARSVGMSRQEARAFIDTYFKRFAGVKAYMDQKKAEAREKGYVTTLDGRKRYLPEIHHRVFSIRQNAERMAINTPIQGTAADLMKKAMLAVRRALKESGLRAQMILQVHDELLFECAEEDLEPLKELVKREMEGAMQLSVPLKVELKAGRDWYSMEKV